MAEVFKLNFITNGEGVFVIDEPVGESAAKYVLKQKDKGFARDITYAGGNESSEKFTFYKDANHEFDLIMYYFETYGWEGKIELIKELDGLETQVGLLDLFQADTEQLEYITCNVIQDTNQSIVKKRNDVKIDLFNDEDVNGDYIEPLTTENVLVRAKPFKQTSAWEMPDIFHQSFSAQNIGSGDRVTRYYTLNPAIVLKKFDIYDSLTFFSQRNDDGNPDDFKIINAANNLVDIKIDITDLDFNVVPQVADGGDGYIDIKLELKYGQSIDTAETITLFSHFMWDDDPAFDLKADFSESIPYLNRGDGVWLYFWFKIRQSAEGFNTDPEMRAVVTVNSMNIDAQATSKSYNTIVPSIRLKDGVSQVIKSISGLETSFPFAEQNGEMYNQRIFNGNLLRKIETEPFNLSLKEIEDWLPEIRADYEVGIDGKVHFLLEKDYYTNEELEVFDDIRFDSYKKYLNKKFGINQFKLKYKKFQSQKENETENTFDIVNGESEWNVLNEGCENKKDESIEFIRDTFMIDDQRTKAFNVSESTATQNDDNIYILDTIELSENLEFAEVDSLQHTVEDGMLKLSNDGSFSFELLGLGIDEIFYIEGDDANAGTYRIKEISDRYVVLERLLETVSENNNGVRLTSFRYIVSPTTAPYISRSKEGFTYIDGLIDEENFANLKYSLKRNIQRFYNSYLATCNIFNDKPIKNAIYNKGRDVGLSYDGLQTIEGDDFTPTNPILSPYMHDITVLCDYLTYKQLEANIRTKRGYIRCFDANQSVIKLYPQEIVYERYKKEGKLTIKGEEKYEKNYINITYADLGYVVLNDEYRTRKIKYEIKGEKISIFDELYKRLYNPVYWYKVSVNNAVPESKEQLKDWLDLMI